METLGSFRFETTIQAGENVIDLDILERDSNGATITDEAGNNFDPSDARNNEINTANYFSDRYVIAIDTEQPVITVSPVILNKVSATVTDNLDTEPEVFLKSKMLSVGTTCDSSHTFRDYTAGAELNVAEGAIACFQGKDLFGNSAYAVSTPGKDIEPPTIIVNPSSDYSDPGRQTTVTAQAGDADLDITSWRSKDISGSATCNAAAVGTSLLSGSIAIHSGHGTSITLADEAYNGRKICFGVKDTFDNWAYAASGVITGIDKTPAIITVSSIIYNKVSATITGTYTTLQAVTIYDGVCSSSTTTTFTSYTAGSDVALASVIGAKSVLKQRMLLAM